MPFIKYLLYMAFVFKVENTNRAKKSKIIAKNTQNNAFVMLVFL